MLFFPGCFTPLEVEAPEVLMEHHLPMVLDGTPWLFDGTPHKTSSNPIKDVNVTPDVLLSSNLRTLSLNPAGLAPKVWRICPGQKS